MITNILLTVILISIITSFVILSNKINRIKFNTKFIIDALKRIDKFVDSNHTNIEHLLGRFNKRILIYEEYYNNLITLLKSRFKDLDDATDNIYDKINLLDTDITKLIIDEHEATRKEVAKRAKFSSKIKSKSKTSKSINK